MDQATTDTNAKIERDRLIENHIPLVGMTARRIRSRLPARIELEEMEADGYVGLVRAASTWESARGVSFQTYAYYRIRGEIIDGLRRQPLVDRRRGISQSERTEVLSLDQIKEEGRDFPADPASDESAENIETRMDADAILSLLHTFNSHGGKHADLLKSWILDGRTQLDIADEMGLTKGRVNQLCTEARRSARRMVEVGERRRGGD